MLTYNYASLLADLMEMTEEKSEEFDGVIDGIIGLGELKCIRELDLECFQQEIDGGVLAIGAREKARPSGLVKANSIWLTVSGAKTYIEQRTYSWCLMYAPTTATQSQPVYYAEKDDGNFYFVPTPSLALPLTVYGIKRPDGLGPNTSTTWLSLNAGDLLLHACLIEAERFLTNPNQAAVWKDAYEQKLGAAKLEFRGLNRGDYLLAQQASQATRQI